MFLTLFIFNLIVVSGWSLWYGSQSFGHRMFVGMSIIFMFGLAALIEKLNEKISFKWITLICGLFIAWNFGLMIQYGSRMIDSEKMVPFFERAKNNIIEVPRKLFILIKRFLFSRGEFLK